MCSEPRSLFVGDARGTVRVSLGTAGVLGLLDVLQKDPPTTAYLMVGDRCQRNCAFCAQARTSRAKADALSRISWPAFDLGLVIERVAQAADEGRIRRCCLQVTASRGYLAEAERVLRLLHAATTVPLSASVAARRVEDVRRLLDAGAERIGLALDAANPQALRAAKGDHWPRMLALLEEAAAAFSGRISTHLIVGLGERESEMVSVFQRLTDLGIRIGLFAFTPVPGTAWEHKPPPPLAAYRRLQAARYLIARGLIRAEDLTFDEEGRILSFGLTEAELQGFLRDGLAFQTAGCPDCNRPYYNERPGGPLYNYPRPLMEHELSAALGQLGIGVATEAITKGSKSARHDTTTSEED